MINFQQVQSSRLFQSNGNASTLGWWGFQIGEGSSIPDHDVPLDSALNDAAWNGTFVYAASAPDLSDSPKTKAFIEKIDEILGTVIGTRALIFLPDGAAASISPQTARAVALTQNSSGVFTNTGLNVPLTGPDGIAAQLAPQSKITVNDPGDGLIFDGGTSPSMSLGGLSPSDTYQPDNLAVLSLAPGTAGAFSFSIFIRRQALGTKLDWGFQVFIPNPGAQSADAFRFLTAWLPLAEGAQPSSTDMLGFTAQINLVNPNSVLAASPTVFLFTGQNSDGAATKLISFYRTSAGRGITLLPVTDASSGQQPAGLTINLGYVKTPQQVGYHFAPVGDYILATDSAKVNESAYLLCGLSGTETIAFRPFVDGQYAGSRMRFALNRPAYAPQFPLQPSSPVGPPLDATARLLNDTFLTAWATVVGPPGTPSAPLYTAAPKGSDLFGRDPIVTSADAGLLGPVGPGVELPSGVVFPLLPFAGFVAGSGEQDLSRDQMELFDRQMLSPTRRNAISSGKPKSSVSAHASLGILSSTVPDCPLYATTPAGFISHVRCDGTWDQLLLAQMTEPSGMVTLQMGFTVLKSELQAAFQTSSLFLVVANDKYLGTPASGTFMPPAQKTVDDKNLFFNTITIGDWSFEAKTGRENAYSDYRNVVLVKGVKGKLTDLVLSPEKWTMKDVFGAPSVTLVDGTVSAPDVSQLIPLSNWLSDYFQAALERRDNPFFTNFCRIIQDDNWTGVLILRADIKSVPRDLAGITAGVTDPAAFYAHHLGIEISQINGATVQQKDSSSLFGLVYYVDPNYDDSPSAHPIPPVDASAPYDFRLLTLKALFQNTSLKKFESLAQINLNRLFGSPVTRMGDGGNIYNAILMQGAFQSNSGAPVYSMSSTSASNFYLANNVLTEVEIDSAVMSTRDDGTVSGKVVSWIALSGYMNFAVITDTSGAKPALPAFDIFSFGAPDSTIDPLRQGLNFSNLGLEITHVGPVTTVDMVEAELSFNIAASTPRANSLYPNFQLELLSLENGDDKRTPVSLGFLTVGTQYGLQGVSDGAWHGLRFKINLGTPGALASKINLSSTLLLAWSDASAQGASGFRAMVAIALPGAGAGGDLFSLQTVLKLSIGAIQLYYNQPQESFLLILNEIALKFLGLLKVPPNGATAFYLFGNPAATSSTGLGWYAIYNQDQPKPPAAALLER